MYSEFFENSPYKIGTLTSKLCCVSSWMAFNCSARESGSPPYQWRADVILGPLPITVGLLQSPPQISSFETWLCSIAHRHCWGLKLNSVNWSKDNKRRTLPVSTLSYIRNCQKRFLPSFVIRSRHWLPRETKLCGLCQSLPEARYS
jgi:hypothetical protein